MSRIRGAHTSPELLLRRELSAVGLRYRLHYRTPGGRADVAFPRLKVAVFLDGCFWHGCPQHYVRPRSNGSFWSSKLRTNVDRDRRQTRTLIELGWKVLRIWEHEVFTSPGVVVRRVTALLSGARRAPRQWRVVRVTSLGGDLETRHLEQLLDPGRCRAIERKRSTRKWNPR